MDESGFLTNASDNSMPDNESHVNSYHDFRLLYSSNKGFCRIFLANRLGRIYVVKCLREEYIGNVVAETALRKEFDTGAMQNSSFVVRTFDFIDLPDLGNCIILEYCPGKTLKDILDSGEIIDDQIVDLIVHALANGIADIHASGIVHRDLKPENIIVAFPNGSVKIIDFGFADSLSFVYLHEAAGTQGYYPIDRLNDEESVCYLDLYAFGVVLNELSKNVSSSRLNPVSTLSERLIKGDVKTASGIISLYNSLIRIPRRSFRRLITWGAIIISVLIVSFLFISLFSEKNMDSKIHYDKETAIDDVPKRNETESDTVSENKISDLGNGNSVEKETASKELNPSAATNINADVKDITDNSDKTFELDGIMIPPDEKIRNVYGVSMAEAKYLGIFKQNKFDFYVVQTTDNIMTEAVVILQSNASYQLRMDAYILHESENSIVEKVIDKVRNKFPDGDLQRARGLAIQRWRFIHSSQSPLSPPEEE